MNAYRGTFPTRNEICDSVSSGRLPYIELAESLYLAETSRDEPNQTTHIGNGLRSFHRSNVDGIPQPPLTAEISELLARAVDVPVVDYREFDWESDELRNGRNSHVKTIDNRQAGRLLMRAILDHGQTAGVAHGQ